MIFKKKKNTAWDLIKNMLMSSQFGGYQIQLSWEKKKIFDYISITVAVHIFQRGEISSSGLKLDIQHKVCLWLNDNCSGSSSTQTRLHINIIIYD